MVSEKLKKGDRSKQRAKLRWRAGRLHEVEVRLYKKYPMSNKEFPTKEVKKTDKKLKYQTNK